MPRYVKGRVGRAAALATELMRALFAAAAGISRVNVPLIAALTAVVLSSGASALAAEPAGKALYTTYCASCHGEDGRGDGPAASVFRRQPTDLTALTKTCGKFPLPEVMSVIDGRRFIAAHGSREMPVWGERFVEELAGEPYPQRTTLFKVREIAEYLATIQQK